MRYSDATAGRGEDQASHRPGAVVVIRILRESRTTVPPEQRQAILDLCAEQNLLERTPVNEIAELIEKKISIKVMGYIE